MFADLCQKSPCQIRHSYSVLEFLGPPLGCFALSETPTEHFGVPERAKWPNRGPQASDLVEVAVECDGTATRVTLKCSENSKTLCQSVASVSRNISEHNALSVGVRDFGNFVL